MPRYDPSDRGIPVRKERLLVFGRLPEPGRVKTRLLSRLTPEASAALYQAFLDDAMRLAPAGAAVELWVPDRPGAAEWLGQRYPDARVRLQPEGTLGDRLEEAFDCAFGEGVERAVAVGSDHSTLPARHIARGFGALAGGTATLVLGPARDGGYYAVGLQRAVWPEARELFVSAPWSEPGLCGWTRARGSALGLACVELPLWYDVDRPSDLKRMAADLDMGAGSATAAAWERLAATSAPARGKL